MTNQETSKAIKNTVNMLIKNINTQTRIALELSALGGKIQKHINDPETKNAIKLGSFAGGATVAAGLTMKTANSIARLSNSLRLLLEKEEPEHD